MSRYKVRKGDSWISIANNNNLNLNDLLYWNSIDQMSKEVLPTINSGSVTGTPGYWKSELGITWSSSNPKNLIP